jgi:sialidase-1
VKAKNTLSGLLVMSLTVLLVNSGYAADPIGLWHLDEGTGVTTVDSSGNNHIGTLVGDPQWVDGLLGKALQFDGQNDSVEISFIEGVPQEYTLSIWLYQISADMPPKAIHDKINYGQTIFSSGGRLDTKYGFWLLTHDGTAVRFYSFESKVHLLEENSLLTEPGVISLNTWHRIAATAAMGKDSVIYVDGKEKARWQNKGLDLKTTTVYLGDLRANETITFNGIIDEVSIFDVILSDEDIAAIAREGLAVSSSGKLTITWGDIKEQ